LKILLSFDIDGTLETGDPPGPVTLEMVRRAKELGCIIGSASDRSVRAQQDMWDRNNIEVDFVSNKHVLIGIRERFEADYYLHMGDRDLDKQFAREADFNFIWMDEAASEPWIAMVNEPAPE
jgi:hydroxymethylpyrimidine pyrophosphatase-like HAD family hydrolase